MGNDPIPKHGRNPLPDVGNRDVRPLPVKVFGREEEGMGVGSIIRDYLAPIIVIQVVPIHRAATGVQRRRSAKHQPTPLRWWRRNGSAP